MDYRRTGDRIVVRMDSVPEFQPRGGWPRPPWPCAYCCQAAESARLT